MIVHGQTTRFYISNSALFGLQLECFWKITVFVPFTSFSVATVPGVDTDEAGAHRTSHVILNLFVRPFACVSAVDGVHVNTITLVK